jgi:hypothetical protein
MNYQEETVIDPWERGQLQTYAVSGGVPIRAPPNSLAISSPRGNVQMLLRAPEMIRAATKTPHEYLPPHRR